MKTRYLLSALTLPLLAACTQEDLGVQVNNSNAALQNRIEVGKVAFTTGADTRFDFGDAAHIGWEDGERFGLFLMDDWNEAGNAAGNGEQMDANETDFEDQQVWNNMYALHNYTQTNIPFTFNRTEGIWENDDAVVEGNYFALAPANGQQTSMEVSALSSIRNRRDVWVYINPVQKFGNEPVGQYNQLRGGIEQNQFFLGYQQVYRNQELTNGEQLMLPLQLHPVLGMVDLTVENADEKPFVVEKIVVRHKDNKPMPTIAYVRPDGNTTEDFPVLLNGQTTWKGQYEEWGPAFAQPYDVAELADECGETYSRYTYNPETWTRSAARSVVQYSYPGENGFTPYGLKGNAAKPVYEYTFDFTGENEDAPAGYILNNGEFFHAYLALPHNMDMMDYCFTVYGKQKDNTTIGGPTWVDGIIIPEKSDEVDWVNGSSENDGEFNLIRVDLASESTYVKAKISFDDFKVVKRRMTTVSSSEDLMRYLRMYESSYDMGTNERFYISTTGDFEITRELCDYVRDLNESSDNSRKGKAIIFFKNVNGKLVFPENLDSDAIDLFYYTKSVNILNKGTQVIEKPIMKVEDAIDALKQDKLFLVDESLFDNRTELLNLLNEAKFDDDDWIVKNGGVASITNEGVLRINASIDVAEPGKIVNEEAAIMEIGAVIISNNFKEYPYSINGNGAAYVQNKGALTLKGSKLVGTLYNNRQTTIKPVQNQMTATEITTLENYNKCAGCPTGIATLVIEEGATLQVGNGNNGSEDGQYIGQITNYGAFYATGKFTNNEAGLEAIDKQGQGNLIINGSAALAGKDTKVVMDGITNESGNHDAAVKYDDLLQYNEGIRNFCTLMVENYGYIYQADKYATIKVLNGNGITDPFDVNNAGLRGGVIENTIHGNITGIEYGANIFNGVIGGQVIILTVNDDKMDVAAINDILEKYHNYNKVVLKGNNLIAGEVDKNVISVLEFDSAEKGYVIGEVEFAAPEIFIKNELVQLAVHYVKVQGTVRLEHGATLYVGRQKPNIDCKVYTTVNGMIEVQNGATLKGLGTNDDWTGLRPTVWADATFIE